MNSEWTSQAWRDEAVSWLDARLAAVAIERTGDVEQPHLRPWATALSAPTTAGTVWLKAAAPGTAFEIALYELLAEAVPDRVLVPIAVDVERAWIVLPDGGPALADRLDGEEFAAAFAAILRRYGELQRRLEPHVERALALGVADRGADRKRSDGQQASGTSQAIVLGTVLDGIPEGIVIGVSLIGGGGVSVAVIAAVFLSNLPESIAGTTGLLRAGYTPRRLYRMWALIAVAVALSTVVGFALFDGSPPETIALVQGFAAGALLTMLADTMMPEAYAQGGRLVGLCTVFGFALAYALTLLG